MPAVTDDLLRYRPWRGTFGPPVLASWAMARTGLALLARRRLFWGLYALALMVFFFFFYGQYLVVWIQQQTANQSIALPGGPLKLADLTRFLDRLNLNGTAHTFGNFVWFQGYVVMIVLALAGAVLVGNDFQYGSLPFYLSKPIGRRHYVFGKCLAVGLFVNLITTAPALLLYLQAGLLYDWEVYYVDHLRQLAGILVYGLALTVTLSLLLVATAVWVRRTVPLVMVWTGLFVLCRLLSGLLADGARLDPRWRLIDLWNDLYLVGLWALGAERDTIRPQAQPEFWEAGVVCAAVCLLCGLYLRRRIQAVEVVS
jgi:ABC-type transport system involved in multi-copper enzyme maturation permease subunit